MSTADYSDGHAGAIDIVRRHRGIPEVNYLSVDQGHISKMTIPVVISYNQSAIDGISPGLQNIY
jgi:hypothetical protein